MDKVTRQCPQTTTFLKRKESRSGIEPRSFGLPAALPLGQTGSLEINDDEGLNVLSCRADILGTMEIKTTD